jgi:hypothetical protein
VTRVHCPECGFQNLEAANYCEKCGALLLPEDGTQTTMSFHPGETVEDVAAALETGVEGTAIIVRLGGGRAGETYPLDRDRLTIGRSPDCDVFLDDVTVSRRHAQLVRHAGGYGIEDLGSLNGTYVNRRRVEATRLEDGDEILIGKYKLTFLER